VGVGEDLDAGERGSAVEEGLGGGGRGRLGRLGRLGVRR
jgi:hypothetical protein